MCKKFKKFLLELKILMVTQAIVFEEATPSDVCGIKLRNLKLELEGYQIRLNQIVQSSLGGKEK